MNRLNQLQDQMNNQSSSKQISSFDKRVIVIGPSGSGKSTIGNILLQKKCFNTGESTESITENIQVESNNIKTKNNQEIYLTVVDTPGIADPNRRSRQFLNKIMQFIKIVQIDLIIIIVPQGRINPQLQDNLIALKYCINVQRSMNLIVIINKFPTEETLKNNNPPQDKEVVRQQAIKKFSQQLDLQDSHTQVFTLQNGFIDQEEFRQNIYQSIYFCSLVVNQECVRTWTEILELYKNDVEKKLNELQISNEKIKLLKLQIEDISKNKKKFNLWNFLFHGQPIFIISLQNKEKIENILKQIKEIESSKIQLQKEQENNNKIFQKIDNLIEIEKLESFEI